MKCLIVIPSRMGSARFPGKPLCLIAGRPMIDWVIEATLNVQHADVVVTTPDQEIIDYVNKRGVKFCLTSTEHITGTDRMAEVAKKIEADIYVNVQGDEPLMDPVTIEACIRPLLENPEVMVSSVYSEAEESECNDPSVVNVVTDHRGYALYFSRYTIPYPREPYFQPLKKHVGIYGMRREPLLQYGTWPVGVLERTESLEQLRFLENGVPIFMTLGKGTELAVDTPKQASIVSEILENKLLKKG